MSLTFLYQLLFYSLVQGSILVHNTNINILSHYFFNTTPELTSSLRETLMPTRHLHLKQPLARKIKAQLKMKAGNHPRRKYATVITKALLIIMDTTTTKSGSGQMKKRLRSKQKNPPSTVK